MAKLLNPKEPFRFTPADQLRRDAENPEACVIPEEARIVYLLKVPTKWDHIEFRKALVAKGARKHGQLGLLRGLRRHLEAILAAIDPDGAQRAALFVSIDGAITSYEAYLADLRAGLYPLEDPDSVEALLDRDRSVRAEYDALDPLRRVVAEAAPGFADMLADEDAYSSIFSMVAARKFLIGWENRPEPFRRDVFGATPETIEALPFSHIEEIGAAVDGLLSPTEPEAKNSDSPSPSSSSRTDSPAASSTDPIIH